MKVIPEIPIIFKGKFPKNFRNEVHAWGCFSRSEIEKNKSKLLTLDIEFGNRCSLNCPHCFRKENKVDSGSAKLMDYDDVIGIVKQGGKLGLRTVKFLGAGEPFENERFIELLRGIKKLGVDSAIFSKGHVIGDDGLAKKWNSSYGINTGEELAEELKRLDASILLGFNSFDTDVQDRMVGNVKGYTIKRNRALEILARNGFNSFNPTRLCIITAPVTNSNYGEIFEIYKWARARNMHVIACPTMVSGRCSDSVNWKKITPAGEKLVELYAKIYEFNIENGIQTLEQIKKDGVSTYAGGGPCNQVACGMYVTLTGTVLRCPGDDVTTFGSIWENSIEDIWKKSENYRRAGTYNCGCPPKAGKTIPHGFYEKVLEKLESRYGKLY